MIYDMISMILDKSIRRLVRGAEYAWRENQIPVRCEALALGGLRIGFPSDVKLCGNANLARTI